MTRGEDLIRNAKCTHGHRSAMSNSAWCDLKKYCTVLKLHDMCDIPKCKCQKQITFSPNQYQLEGNAFKNTMKKIFKGSQSAWNKFLKTALNVAAPFIGMAVSAKTKNPKVGATTINILRSFSGGKILSLRDRHGRVSRLKVM